MPKLIEEFNSGGEEFRSHLNQLVHAANEHDADIDRLKNDKGEIQTLLVVVNGEVCRLTLRGNLESIVEQ